MQMCCTPVRDLFARAIKLNPGAWSVERERPMSTLLGSCIAVCLYDPKLRLAGMNHFLLPSRLSTQHECTDIVLAGDAAMEVLVNAMLVKGARKDRLEAKIFGGGTIVNSIHMAIGERNATFASEWLAREGIRVVASDLLGNFSRTVVLDPCTGDAYCRRSPVDQASAQRIVSQEAAYEKRLLEVPKQPRVELF